MTQETIRIVILLPHDLKMYDTDSYLRGRSKEARLETIFIRLTGADCSWGI